MQEYWQWFLRLNNRRPTGMGVGAIPYSEMQAFFDLIGVAPDPYEIEIIELFDSIAMKHHSAVAKKEQEKANKKK